MMRAKGLHWLAEQPQALAPQVVAALRVTEFAVGVLDINCDESS
jgi:hypothetical protein